MEIRELVRDYRTAKTAAGLSIETIDRVTSNVEYFCRDTGISTPSQITTNSAIEWGEIKLELIMSSTLSTYYNSLRQFLNYLDEVGIEYPADKSRLHCKPISKRPELLRPNEIRRVIRHADQPTAVLIRLLFTSGMRISEALSLTRTHLIDGDTVMYVKAKGGNMRPVFITKELHKQLWELSEDGGHIFLDAWGVPLDRRKAYWHIKQAMIHAGYPKAHPHTLRHSSATDMLRNGASLSHVQRFLGHSNISVTQRYLHLVVDDVQAAHTKYLTVV